MKSPGAINHKLKQLKYRAYKEIASNHLSKRPSNCQHNIEVTTESGLEIRLCGKYPNTICDDNHHDGRIRAKRCDEFSLLVSKEEIKVSTESFFKESKLSTIAQSYPDIAALLWVLQEVDLPSNMQYSEDEDVSLLELAISASNSENQEDNTRDLKNSVSAVHIDRYRELVAEEDRLAMVDLGEATHELEDPTEEMGGDTEVEDSEANIQDLAIPPSSYYVGFKENYLTQIPFVASIIASLHFLYLKILFFR